MVTHILRCFELTHTQHFNQFETAPVVRQHQGHPILCTTDCKFFHKWLLEKARPRMPTYLFGRLNGSVYLALFPLILLIEIV